MECTVFAEDVAGDEDERGPREKSGDFPAFVAS